MPSRAANATQTFQRQHSIPEGREYSPMPSSEDPLMMPITDTLAPDIIPDSQMMNNLDLGLDSTFSWEMIGLGLEEPMPMQEAIDELYVSVPSILHSSLSNRTVEQTFISTRFIHLYQCFTNTDIFLPWTYLLIDDLPYVYDISCGPTPRLLQISICIIKTFSIDGLANTLSLTR